MRRAVESRRGLLAATLAVAAAAAASAQQPAGFDPRAALKTSPTADKDEYRRLKEERDEVGELLRERQREGRPVAVAKQTFAEARWALSATTDYARVRRLFAAVRTGLDGPDAAQRVAQSEADGSFGPGHEEWFFKLEATVDRLILLQHQEREPDRPLSFLDRINSPERLRDHFEAILVSDPRRDGVDHRKALNFSASGLVRLIGGSVASGFEFHRDLRSALDAFLDDRWQNPATGYWGAWYRDGDRLIKTDDLSITYHIVAYREGAVALWPRIIDTTLGMAGGDYPYGWLEEGRRSLHHYYDVVSLLRLGWPHADAAQREAAAKAMDDMVDWCLREGMRADGTFDETGTGGEAEALYFGVSFLSVVGFFDGSCFWSDRAFPDADATRQRLLRAAWDGDLSDAHTWFAIGRLRGR